jgi:hypothetical protein
MVPLPLLVICVVSGIGFILPMSIDGHVEDDVFVSRAVPAALGIVTIVALINTRLVVLPRAIRGESSGPADGGRAPTFREIEGSATFLACMFAVSPAMYGCVAAIYIGESRWALIFGAAALFALTVHGTFVRSALQQRRRELLATGNA